MTIKHENYVAKALVGEHTFIGSGSLVTKNILNNVLAYEIPAKIIRKRKNWRKISDFLHFNDALNEFKCL